MKKKVLIFVVILVVIAAIVFGLLHKNDETINSNNIAKENNIEENSNKNAVQREEVSEYVAKTEYGTHVNTSGEMQNTKSYKGLELNNVNLETLGNRTIMLIDAKNTTKETINEKTIKVDLLSKEGKEVATLTGTQESVEPDKIVQINLEIEGDYTDVYDYKIYE